MEWRKVEGGEGRVREGKERSGRQTDREGEDLAHRKKASYNITRSLKFVDSKFVCNCSLNLLNELTEEFVCHELICNMLRICFEDALHALLF